jgi:hypothetical protein
MVTTTHEIRNSSNQPGTSNQEIELYQEYPDSSYTESIDACGCGLLKILRFKLYHSKFSAKLCTSAYNQILAFSLFLNLKKL